MYWLWHTFLLGEDELALFLDVARAHQARVVRDAARVIEQLQQGHDVRGLPAAWTARVMQYANDARARACNAPATP